MKAKIKNCLLCEVDISDSHPNRKMCEECSLLSRKKPKGTMTKTQIAQAKKMAGKAPREEIAKNLGVSLSNLKRSCPKVSFVYYYKYKANPSMVKEVLKYYEKNGRKKTEEKYKDENVKIRSIVEKYKNYSPRQVRWKNSEILMAVKMAGLFDFNTQAKYFNRPNAHKGSLRSLWSKRLHGKPSDINGMHEYKALLFVKKTCPHVKTEVGAGKYNRKLYLYSDMKNHLRKSCPDFIRKAIIALAEFQEKLWQTKNVRKEVRKLQRKLG